MLNEGTAPALDQFDDVQEPEAVVVQPQELAVQCVLYTGDILTDRQKKSSPFYRNGGKQFPITDFRTVPHSVVQRCAITRLSKHFRSVAKSMVDKEKWDGYDKSYTLKNQWNPATEKYEDIVVGKPDLLYKPIRPIHELGRIAGQQNGVVALDAEAGIEKGSDIKDAQLHYFPNWFEIVAQIDTVPERLRELEDHIRSRREATQSSSLRAIGDAFLTSISDYFIWGKAYVDWQTKVIKETDKSPGGAMYDEVAERLFRVLELQRQDSFVVDMARNQNDAAATNALLTQVLSQVAAKGDKTDALLEAMVGVLQNKPAEPTAHAPAPVTVAEAAAEVDRAIEEGTVADEVVEQKFVDMSEVVVEPEPKKKGGRDV